MTKKNFSQFEGKKIIVTGHTGFKGSWLSTWLTHLGADVVGISLKELPSKPSHFGAVGLSEKIKDCRINIKNSEEIKKLLISEKPDFIFHLAAQSLVRFSYKNPLETMMTNAQGTANLLEAIRFLENKLTAVFITSDKVYDNVEWTWGYREQDRLGGKDPYSASKGMAELAIRGYFQSFLKNNDNIRLGIARAGNVIGGGDWAVDRIVPDCVKAWAENKSVDIRNPNATRPWQHVLEPLSGYLSLAVDLADSVNHHGEAYNFGPHAHQNFSVSELIDEMSKHWENVAWEETINDKDILHEAILLKLNCDKALFDLNWQPTMSFDETIKMTVEWYKEFYDSRKMGMLNFTISQIQEFEQMAKERNLGWANYV